MNKLLLKVLFFALLAKLSLHHQEAVSQTTFLIKGRITEALTGHAIPFATAFLDGTTIAVVVDSVGYFQMIVAQPGIYVLAVTMTGYKLSKKNISVSANSTVTTVNFSLEALTVSLSEVQIKGKRDKAWEQNYKRFEKLFLENSFGKDRVVIQNKEILNFTTENNLFRANAPSVLNIENHYLGYRVHVHLEEFKKDNQLLHLLTTTRFEPMISLNAETQQQWEKHRKDAYAGSSRHFFAALYKNRLTEEGFDAHLLKSNSVPTLQNRSFYGNREGYQNLSTDLILQKTDSSAKKRLSFRTPIEVVYTKQYVSRPVFRDAPHPFSIIQMKRPTTIDSSGWITDPSAIVLFGDMSKKGVSEWLPYDYSPLPQPHSMVVPSSQHSPIISLEINSRSFLAGDTICIQVDVRDSLSPKTLTKPYTLIFELKKGDVLMKKYRIKTESRIIETAISLPDSLPSGAYTLWAYTNKMRSLTPMPLFGTSFSVMNFQKRFGVWQTESSAVSEIQKEYDNVAHDFIEGTVIDAKKRQPIANAHLTLVPIDSLFRHPFFSDTDKAGQFRVFDSTLFYGVLKTVVKVENRKGHLIDAIVRLAPEKSWIPANASKPAALDSVSLKKLFQRHIERNNSHIQREGKTLSEVIIKGNRTIDFNYDSDNHLLWKIYDEPDGYILMDEKKRNFQTILMLLSSHIPSLTIKGDGIGVPFTYTFRGPNTITSTGGNNALLPGPLFLVDGVPVEAPRYQTDFLLTLLPTDINRIDYLTNKAGTYGVSASISIVIAIYTNHGKSKSTNNGLGNLIIEGYHSLKCR
ncbi:carboxypeptidase-like regulatory domain-containing protein [Runella sp.]|uniref:carboxypeptidase-like regulatory domain-containing protein n=1 Tax=Runella sp. TaxID=1960881 RepID=UPI003D0C067E